MDRPRATLVATTLDAPDPRALAAFYRHLLGWDLVEDSPEWVSIGPPGGGHRLSFQAEPHHVPPVWPAGDGDQRLQLHLDVEVDDLAAAGAHAEAGGAVLAAFQPQEGVRVYLDPAGHPFCLFLPGS
ncbi:VOC family protein [Kineococcus rubinsiae]|uniref:VOC family protein n=1 Tax=Kineococcus rubinsiae TaxID=2609562 RepID=UPI0014318EA1|nr:VOC family protein [Kineococcus rubinsiae]NIZ92743.1 VOC family protein [Kineococcus rubinsiae]